MNKTLSNLKVYCEFEKIFQKGMAISKDTIEPMYRQCKNTLINILSKNINDNLSHMIEEDTFINEGTFQEYDYNNEDKECEWKQFYRELHSRRQQQGLV